MGKAVNIKVGEVSQPALVGVLGHLPRGPLPSRQDHGGAQVNGAGEVHGVFQREGAGRGAVRPDQLGGEAVFCGAQEEDT